MKTKFRTIGTVEKGNEIKMGKMSIKQPLPGQNLDQISPFLLLHHWGPKLLKPGFAMDVGAHPHRGFEPVTFLFQGEINHKDSLGNFGELKSGDVQWMTAGRGIVHSERAPKSFQESGGWSHGIQLWVNLPKKDKMATPKYQDIKAENIPSILLDENGSLLRIIAGEYQGKKGPASTFTPILAIHVVLKKGISTELLVPENFNAFTYTTIGEVTYNKEQSVSGSYLVEFNKDGDKIYLEAKEDSELLLLAGEPIKEPVAQWGPYVMNTQTELLEAMRDFQIGKMGILTD